MSDDCFMSPPSPNHFCKSTGSSHILLNFDPYELNPLCHVVNKKIVETFMVHSITIFFFEISYRGFHVEVNYPHNVGFKLNITFWLCLIFLKYTRIYKILWLWNDDLSLNMVKITVKYEKEPNNVNIEMKISAIPLNFGINGKNYEHVFTNCYILIRFFKLCYGQRQFKTITIIVNS